jgi:cytochrome c
MDMRWIARLLGATLLCALAQGGAALAQGKPAGEAVFAKCRACHQIGPEAKNILGPHRNNLIGRAAGSVEGYSYSAANKNSGLTWSEENFAAYIRDPRAAMPGTKMVFPGLKNDDEVQALIAFLKGG